jgi:hypothetical protein
MLRVSTTSLRLAAGVQPSLALFATLEQLLRVSGLNNLPVVLAAVLAAVEALLEPVPPGGCGCSQGGQLCGSTGSATPSSTSAANSIPANTSNTVAATNTTTGSSTNSSSSSSGPQFRSEMVTAVASCAVTVNKVMLLMEVARSTSGQQPGPGVLDAHRAVRAVSLRLSNAVLQLALQQLRHHQQPGGRKALLQLIGGAQRLLHYTSVEGLSEGRRHVIAGLSSSRSAVTAQTASPPTQGQVDSAKLLVSHLHSGQLRLSALQQALSQAASTAGLHQVDGMQILTGQTVAAAASSSQRAATAGGPALGPAVTAPRDTAGPPTCTQQWCPMHSSTCEPTAAAQCQQLSWVQLMVRVARTHNAIYNQIVQHSRRQPLLLGCSNPGCSNLDGPSEASLVDSCCGVVCSRCGVVRYCRPECAQLAWSEHRKVCGRLAAALGRRAAGSSSTSGSSSGCHKLGREDHGEDVTGTNPEAQ